MLLSNFVRLLSRRRLGVRSDVSIMMGTLLEPSRVTGAILIPV